VEDSGDTVGEAGWLRRSDKICTPTTHKNWHKAYFSKLQIGHKQQKICLLDSVITRKDVDRKPSYKGKYPLLRTSHQNRYANKIHSLSSCGTLITPSFSCLQSIKKVHMASVALPPGPDVFIASRLVAVLVVKS
jgi:hypothetical protein